MNPSASPDERSKLEQAIAAQETLRGTVDDTVIDTVIATLKEKLAALETAEPGAQHRKLVSILFMDIVGSTDIIRDLDPEDSAAILDEALRRLALPVTEHGGRVTRFMGDGFVALFGDPIARENDPEMAIRAGLGVLMAAESYATEVASDWGIQDFGVRVGINTGMVLIGGYAEAEDTLTGAAVNLAARLESAAPRQGLLISQGTYQHVPSLFDTEPQEPISAKGFKEPVPVYLITGARPRVFRMGRHGVHGIQTRMVGRDRELRVLEETFSEALERNQTWIVTVVAEAGLGKSRLLDEFELWLTETSPEVTCLKGRARMETQSIPYGLLRDLFAHRFEVQDDDSATDVVRKLEQRVGEIMGRDSDTRMKSEYIGRLLGYDIEASGFVQTEEGDAMQTRDLGLNFMLEAVRIAAKQRPIVILLEDIHWADESSLDVVAQLGNSLQYHPVFAVAAARPEIFQRRPDWGKAAKGHSRIDLDPLSELDCTKLVLEVLQKVEKLPRSLQDLIVNNAEGNPFYAEELIKMLVDDGVLEASEPHWRVHLENVERLRVPPTLTGVLQARLDSLPESDRQVLQQASVAGRVFWTDMVRRLQPDDQLPDLATLAAHLARLQQRGMIYEHEVSAYAGTQEYLFKHAVLHEVTYESVLKRLRRVFHGQIARWLIEHRGDRRKEHLGLIADHLERAGDTRAAKAYLVEAAEQAAAGFANREAASYYGRAITLMPQDDLASLYLLHEAQERLLDLVGDRAAQVKALEAMEQLAGELDEKSFQAASALRWTEYFERIGDAARAVSAADRAIELSALTGTPEVAAAARNTLARVYWRQGEADKAREQADGALALAREARDQAREGQVLNTLGILARQAGEFEKALHYYLEYLEITRATNDRRGEAAALNNLGAVALAREDFQTTRRHLEACLEILREIGDRQREGSVLGNLGVVAARVGAFTDAEAHYEESLKIAREVGDRQSEGLKLANLGLLATKTGANKIAKDYFHAGLDIARESGALSLEAEALTGLGHAHLALGESSKARAAYEAAAALHHQANEDHRAAEPLAGLARIGLAEGNIEDAMSYVLQILPHLGGERQLEGAEEPLRVYHTCFKVFQSVGDQRAYKILEAAHQRLQRAADRLNEPAVREIYLGAVPWHREIKSAWQAAHTAD